MEYNQILICLTNLLQSSIDQEGEPGTVHVDSTSPLIGEAAILSSFGLVSYIADVETKLVENYDLELILVNESALSRRHSPFRTVETLANYIMELAEEIQVRSNSLKI